MSCWPGRPRRSRKSTALKLSGEILFQAAQRRIIDNETKESISADLHEFLAEAHVHARSLDRWLDAVYQEYWNLFYSSVRKMALAANEADALSDPEIRPWLPNSLRALLPEQED